MKKISRLESDFANTNSELEACKKHQQYLYETLAEAQMSLKSKKADTAGKCKTFDEIVQEAQSIPEKCASHGATFVAHNYGNMEMFLDYTKRYKEWLEKCETAKNVQRAKANTGQTTSRIEGKNASIQRAAGRVRRHFLFSPRDDKNVQQRLPSLL